MRKRVRGLGPGWENEVEVLEEEASEPMPGRRAVRALEGRGWGGGGGGSV